MVAIVVVGRNHTAVLVDDRLRLHGRWPETASGSPIAICMAAISCICSTMIP